MNGCHGSVWCWLVQYGLSEGRGSWAQLRECSTLRCMLAPLDKCISYRLAESLLVDVASEHGTGRKNGWVGWWHHGCWHGPQAEEGDIGRAEMLEHDRENHIGLLVILGRHWAIARLVPIWNRTRNLLLITADMLNLVNNKILICFNLDIQTFYVKQSSCWIGGIQ